MDLPSYFKDFLKEVRPTPAMRAEYQEAHRLLRKRLREFEPLKEALVDDFLQGSYRRWTLIRPAPEKLADVDIIVVTRLARSEWTPENVLKLFTLFAEEHYAGKHKAQGRSLCVTLSGLSLDIVPTAAPSEEVLGMLSNIDVDSIDDLEDAEEERVANRLAKGLSARADSVQPEWKTEPLLVPDRDAKVWVQTNPLEQLAWTRAKNGESGGHYVNVIKALKWWRREALKDIKRPKGYPLERAFAECFPSGDVGSVAKGITLTLENFVSTFAATRNANEVPDLRDYGVPEQNVMTQIAAADFASLFDAVQRAAPLAREALEATTIDDSALKWHALLGDPFPKLETEKHEGGFTPRTEPSSPRPARFG